MSIVYIHGVNTRSAKQGEALAKPLLGWLGPKFPNTPDYIPVYWGDICEHQFRWGLQSRPRTSLLGMGAEDADPLESLASARAMPRTLGKIPYAAPAAADSILLGGPPVLAEEDEFAGVPEGRRADFVADLYLAVRSADIRLEPGADVLEADPDVAALAWAAEQVAGRWDEIMAAEVGNAARAEALVAAVDRLLSSSDLLAAGAVGDWWAGAGEILSRALHAPGDIVAAVVAEGRPALNGFAANFLGDVLLYLDRREGADCAPGEIPRRVIDALLAAEARRRDSGEPIVVLTHSMGGQLLYDAVTYFADRVPGLADLEIHHWFSCGAQVSFFAELGLFKGQPATRDPDKLPMPARVKSWTNFFDHNDFVGFVMAPVFDGVTDIPYGTGYGLATAHSGYLTRPSFFKELAARLVIP